MVDRRKIKSMVKKSKYLQWYVSKSPEFNSPRKQSTRQETVLPLNSETRGFVKRNKGRAHSKLKSYYRHFVDSSKHSSEYQCSESYKDKPIGSTNEGIRSDDVNYNKLHHLADDKVVDHKNNNSLSLTPSTDSDVSSEERGSTNERSFFGEFERYLDKFKTNSATSNHSTTPKQSQTINIKETAEPQVSKISDVTSLTTKTTSKTMKHDSLIIGVSNQERVVRNEKKSKDRPEDNRHNNSTENNRNAIVGKTCLKQTSDFDGISTKSHKMKCVTAAADVNCLSIKKRVCSLEKVTSRKSISPNAGLKSILKSPRQVFKRNLALSRKRKITFAECVNVAVIDNNGGFVKTSKKYLTKPDKSSPMKGMPPPALMPSKNSKSAFSPASMPSKKSKPALTPAQIALRGIVRKLKDDRSNVTKCNEHDLVNTKIKSPSSSLSQIFQGHRLTVLIDPQHRKRKSTPLATSPKKQKRTSTLVDIGNTCESKVAANKCVEKVKRRLETSPKKNVPLSVEGEQRSDPENSVKHISNAKVIDTVEHSDQIFTPSKLKNTSVVLKKIRIESKYIAEDINNAKPKEEVLTRKPRDVERTDLTETQLKDKEKYEERVLKSTSDCKTSIDKTELPHQQSANERIPELRTQSEDTENRTYGCETPKEKDAESVDTVEFRIYDSETPEGKDVQDVERVERTYNCESPKGKDVQSVETVERTYECERHKREDVQSVETIERTDDCKSPQGEVHSADTKEGTYDPKSSKREGVQIAETVEHRTHDCPQGKDSQIVYTVNLKTVHETSTVVENVPESIVTVKFQSNPDNNTGSVEVVTNNDHQTPSHIAPKPVAKPARTKITSVRLFSCYHCNMKFVSLSKLGAHIPSHNTPQPAREYVSFRPSEKQQYEETLDDIMGVLCKISGGSRKDRRSSVTLEDRPPIEGSHQNHYSVIRNDPHGMRPAQTYANCSMNYMDFQLSRPIAKLNYVHHCKHCDRKFKNLDNLKRHERAHDMEKMHGCWFCDQTFSLSSERNKHEQSHAADDRPVKVTKEVPFQSLS